MTKFDLDTTNPSIERVSKQSIKGLKQTTLKSITRAKQNLPTTRTLILADISGSMSGEKMRGLKDALNNTLTPGVECIGFEDNMWEIAQADVDHLYSMGGTHMLEALHNAWEKGSSHMVLITDGEPTDANEEQILQEVRLHKEIPIDTIGLGDQGCRNYNPEFLRRIAEITGGRFTDVGQPIKLTNTLQFLLDYKPTGLKEGGSGSMSGGVIQL